MKKTYGRRGLKKTGTVIPDHRGNKCEHCGKNTRNRDRLYCKICRYKLHYGRQVDAWGNPRITLEDFVNDPFYD